MEQDNSIKKKSTVIRGMKGTARGRQWLAGLRAGCLILIAGLPACHHNTVEKGNLCLRLGDYPAAIKFFSIELNRHPDCYEARLGLAKAMLQKSADLNSDPALWNEGLMHLEAARTLAPSGDEEKIGTLLSQAWAQNAKSQLSLQDTISALSALARAIEYDPGSVEPLNRAGILYFQIGDEKKAVALFARAVVIDSAHPSAYFNLGMIYWQKGAVSEAHQQWLKALRLAPKDEDIIYWFALAEKKMREAGTE
jgi:tetratricopeptide (TPR) repeat protein